MVKSPIVSIIVPVYKVESYLPQCIQSILHQTFQDFELILVDDESPDHCPQICDDFAGRDRRIQVIHKKNEGAIYARAAGLQASAGRYCLFVDGDDWIDPETLACCVHAAEQWKSDCVLFGYIREYPGNSIPNPLFDANFNYNADQSEKLVHRRLVGPVGKELSAPHRVDNLSPMWTKLFRTEVVQKGRIISERIIGTSEDTIFNLYALDGCCISYLNRCFYHYRKDNTQSITTCYKPDLADKRDILYGLFEEYIASSGREAQYTEAFFNRVACDMIGLGLNEVSSSAGFLQKSRRIRELLSRSLYQEAFKKLDTRYCPIWWKLFFFLCRHKMGFCLTGMLLAINKLKAHVPA